MKGGRFVTIAVTGSIATDHLMRFPGRFSEQLLAEQRDSGRVGHYGTARAATAPFPTVPGS